MINDLKKEFDENKKIELIYKYLLTWPLQCACSIYTTNDDVRLFVAEYIIPQLVMQVIRESDIKGVIYFSVKGNYTKQISNPVMLNYAFPAEYTTKQREIISWINEPKYSPELIEIFKMTEAVNVGLWSNLTTSFTAYTNIERINDNEEPIVKNQCRYETYIPLNNEIEISYSKSTFFRVEDFLNRMNVKSIDDIEIE